MKSGEGGYGDTSEEKEAKMDENNEENEGKS